MRLIGAEGRHSVGHVMGGVGRAGRARRRYLHGVFTAGSVSSSRFSMTSAISVGPLIGRPGW